MKYFFIILMSIAFLSCRRDNDKICYECDTQLVPNGQYRDAGCYTKEEWNSFNLTDDFGNSIDKNTRCRKR
jgi:hypothetical protein